MISEKKPLGAYHLSDHDISYRGHHYSCEIDNSRFRHWVVDPDGHREVVSYTPIQPMLKSSFRVWIDLGKPEPEDLFWEWALDDGVLSQAFRLKLEYGIKNDDLDALKTVLLLLDKPIGRKE